MTIDCDSVVKQAQQQLSCRIDNDVAILNLKSTLYFGLDDVGAFIWQAIERPVPVGAVLRSVMDHYNVNETECRTDILSFLNKLNEAGLLEKVSST